MAHDHAKARQGVKRLPSLWTAALGAALLLLAGAVTAARAQERDGRPRFSGDSAFRFLQTQVELGPRVPGSDAHESAVEAYVDWFRDCGASVRIQQFDADIPARPAMNASMRPVTGYNVIARFGSKATPDYMFCAHFDTRPWADEDQDPARRMEPGPGANDGASGVAVLLEMARLFAEQAPPVTVEIVLFDLEDAGISGRDGTWALGSSYYARNHVGRAPAGTVLLDMVGDADLRIPKEYFSRAYAPRWTDYIFDLAAEVDAWALVDEPGQPVYDDHVPLLRAGFKACDLIDFDYPHWHTHQDTPEACSPASLEQVGRVLVRLVYGP